MGLNDDGGGTGAEQAPPHIEESVIAGACKPLQASEALLRVGSAHDLGNIGSPTIAPGGLALRFQSPGLRHAQPSGSAIAATKCCEGIAAELLLGVTLLEPVGSKQGSESVSAQVFPTAGDITPSRHRRCISQALARIRSAAASLRIRSDITSTKEEDAPAAGGRFFIALIATS